jgi:hypothetical protein
MRNMRNFVMSFEMNKGDKKMNIPDWMKDCCEQKDREYTKNLLGWKPIWEKPAPNEPLTGRVVFEAPITFCQRRQDDREGEK